MYSLLGAYAIILLIVSMPPAIEADIETLRRIHESNEPQRVTFVIADQEGEATIVTQNLAWRYATEWDAQAHCASIAPEVQSQSPECLIISEYEARRAGNFERRADLYMPGYCRDRSRERLRGAPERSRELWREHPVIRISRGWRWGEYVFITADIFKADMTQRRGSLGVARFDSQTQRYWLTEEVGLLNYIIWSVPISDEIEGVNRINSIPHDLRAMKVLVDMDSARENRKIQIRDIVDAKDIDRNDLIIALRENRLIHRDTPFMQIKPWELDAQANDLREALVKTLDPEVNNESRLNHWHPSVRAAAERSLENQSWPPPEFQIRPSALPSLHVVSRVNFTPKHAVTGESIGDFIVWFGWIKEHRDLERTLQDDADGPKKAISILMRRHADRYLLDSVSGGGFAIQIARDPAIVQHIVFTDAPQR